MISNKRVIGVVGMPGSGKSVVSKVARKYGFSVVVMGDIIRKEVVVRGLEANPENVGRIMLKIREEEGDTIVAKRCVPAIINKKGLGVIIEGIRSLAEIEVFRKNFSNFRLISIHSSRETRFKRLYKRRRSDDPSSWNDFLERDRRELDVGLGSAMVMADQMILNEGGLKQFKADIKSFIE